MKKNQILLIVAMFFIALGGCSNSEPDYSEFYKDPNAAQNEPEYDPTLEDNQIRVMSFNIRYYNDTKDTGEKAWEYRRNGFVSMIDEQKPTVVGMQEARPPQLEWLEKNWKDYEYIGKGRRANNSNSDEFVPIFYRKKAVELLSWGCFWLSETPDLAGSWGWDSTVPRIATWAIFKHKVSGKKFFFVNTHIDVGSVIAPGKSMEVIVDKMSELNPDNLPMLLTGDFNMSISATQLNEVKTIMTDVRSAAPVTDGKFSYTGFGDATHHIVDHIFCSGFKPLTFETIDKKYNNIVYISDHYPVVGKLEFIN